MLMVYSNKVLVRDLISNAFQAIKWKQLREYHLARMTAEKDGKEMEYIELDPVKIFHKAVENASPLLWMSTVKRGGTTYQVPSPIKDLESQYRALQWIREASRDKQGHIRYVDKLAWEILDAYNNQGSVIKKKRDLHALCETNKAYAHFRWGS